MNSLKTYLICGALGLLVACTGPTPPQQSVATTLSDPDVAGFRRALAPRRFRFPEDHGAHPDYKHEWWYLTGQVTGNDGSRFGYQFTLFRRALSAVPEKRASAWATNQVYLAHFAVSDISNQQFQSDERYARGALQLAGVTSQPFRAWLEDWSLSSTKTTCPDCFNTLLHVKAKGIDLELSLRNQRAPVLHGDHGLSHKSDTPGNASYYYSYPRLVTEGRLSISGRAYAVTGSSWFDHEWSTSALEPEQTGWDWFSLQLSDQSELMLFRLRHRDPGQSRLSGTYVDNQGARKLDNFSLVVKDHWHSPHTGVRYPRSWQIDIPALRSRLLVTPWLADQEMNMSFRYWEGAVKITGRQGGRQVSGNGYMELTGYR